MIDNIPTSYEGLSDAQVAEIDRAVRRRQRASYLGWQEAPGHDTRQALDEYRAACAALDAHEAKLASHRTATT